MSDNKLITPRKVQGFWELMPNEQMVFSSLLNKIEDVFQKNCFVPLDTPILEYSDALLAKSGGETDKQVFRFSKGENDLCMRYDLTVPLARFVAMHKGELNFPFKRYQIGKVFRGERPQKGRYREFYQCDADIIGNGELSLVADAECINLLKKCFEAIDLDVTIKISNRKILSGFIQSINKESLSHEILTVLDKMDKIKIEDALAQLSELGLNEKDCKNLVKLSKISGKIEEITENLKILCQNELFMTGVSELIEVSKYLKSFGLNNEVYDMSIIRGHDYYTGTVFEVFDKENSIALGGGGRFDNLCSYFSKDKMPGVGMSVGITRLFDLMKDKLTKGEHEIDVAIINFDETLNEALSVCSELRNQGIKADVLYENKTFKSKMKEANRRNIKYCLIIGEDEVAQKEYTLKDMQSGEQNKLNLQAIVKKLKNE